MESLEQLVQRSINPFDPASFKPGNFWQEQPNLAQEVSSLHQEAIAAVEAMLDQVQQDQRSRTLLLAGDSGSGKSYLLGRLKRQLSQRAGFAYIGPWADSQYLWRHVLRSTIDSLMQTPAGQSESQLLRWLRPLPGLSDRLDGQQDPRGRSRLVAALRASFPSGIYNAKEFFGVLCDLGDPELRPLACDWLRGDDLDEADLSALGVRGSISSEDAAQKILINFGRIAAASQPIVLCFDNLDNIPQHAGTPDLQALLNVNSVIHNENLQNFLVLISIITSTWRQAHAKVQPADKARIDQSVSLKAIDLDQAAALWASRLAALQQQSGQVADPSDRASAIAPLRHEWLTAKFPGGRALPRNVLMLGQQLIGQIKTTGGLEPPPPPLAPHLPPPPPPPRPRAQAIETASLGLLWEKELEKGRDRIRQVGQLSSPELIWRLREALEALQVSDSHAPLLKGSKFAAYSLRYSSPVSTGLIWSEDRNMTSFYHIMRACEKTLQQHRCDRLYLIRAADLGRPSSKGHQIYRQVFAYANYLHIVPDLGSIHCLEAYHSLVNAAAGGELVVGQSTPTVAMLQQMVRQAGCLNSCTLLQELEVVPEQGQRQNPAATPAATREKPRSQPAKTRPPAPANSPESQARSYILNLITTQGLMGLQVLVENTRAQVPDLSEAAAAELIEQLCRENLIQRVDPNAAYPAQLICWVPS